MNKRKTELQVLNISSCQSQAGAFALLLGEVGGNRQLPIIIGAIEAQAIIIELRGFVSPRPLTHGLFASVIEALGAKMMRTLIYRVNNGVFYSYLYMKTEGAILQIDARTSDAIALALHTSTPIFIYEEILEAECLKTGTHSPQTTDDGKMSKNTQSQEDAADQLKAALQKAIEEEEYERAAQLRDQINQLNSNL